jgi:hypothetical protein
MREKAYTNRELADGYFSIQNRAANRESYDAYFQHKERIARLDVDLQSFYDEHGSLKGLNVRGIGDKTKGTLELILKHGIEEARRMIRGERIEKEQREMEKAQRDMFKEIPNKVWLEEDDTPPTWDNRDKDLYK